MNSSLKERFARLGPTQVVGRTQSGSAAVFALRPTREGLPAIRAVSAALALAKRGIPLLRAKRIVEELLERGAAIVALPSVEDRAAVVRDLALAGIEAGAQAPVTDVRRIRESLGLTQERFALRFGLDLAVLRNWEQGRTQPEKAVTSYLHVIAHSAAQVEEAIASSFDWPVTSEDPFAGVFIVQDATDRSVILERVALKHEKRRSTANPIVREEVSLSGGAALLRGKAGRSAKPRSRLRTH